MRVAFNVRHALRGKEVVKETGETEGSTKGKKKGGKKLARVGRNSFAVKTIIGPCVSFVLGML